MKCVDEIIGSFVYCVLVCCVVCELLVLLKNNGGVLLFDLCKCILVVGEGVDNIFW